MSNANDDLKKMDVDELEQEVNDISMAVRKLDEGPERKELTRRRKLAKNILKDKRSALLKESGLNKRIGTRNRYVFSEVVTNIKLYFAKNPKKEILKDNPLWKEWNWLKKRAKEDGLLEIEPDSKDTKKKTPNEEKEIEIDDETEDDDEKEDDED